MYRLMELVTFPQIFFFSSRRRHTRLQGDWSSDVCSSDLGAPARILDRPSGERARDLGDVFLRVAAVHAERVQLHQLAAVVLVEPLRCVLALRLQTRGEPFRKTWGQVSASLRTETWPCQVSARSRTETGPRVRAHPVVEIEEHRGALRGGAEQVAEVAEHPRSDRVALVLGQHEAIAPLARVDVEMVEPEIGEQLLELALAVVGAQQLLLRELDDDAVGFTLDGIRRLLIRRSRLAGLRVRFPLAARLDLRPLVVVEDLPRAEADGREAGQPPRHRGVRNPLRVKLLVEIARDAHRPNCIDIAGPRTPTGPVQEVRNGLVVGPGTGLGLQARSIRRGQGGGRYCQRRDKKSPHGPLDRGASRTFKKLPSNRRIRWQFSRRPTARSWT